MTNATSSQRYHDYMLGSSFDRPIRGAFNQAVCSLVQPGATILDFGAGTGIDSKTYAKFGYKVRAYDASNEMREYLAGYCRSEIEAGLVSILDLEYQTFLGTSAPSGQCVQAITANFAVLNLIQDQAQLFKAFDRWLAPDGLILASVLSPYYLGYTRHQWWWQNLSRLLRTGRYSVGTVNHRTYFGISTLKQAASPHFALSGIVGQGKAASTSFKKAVGVPSPASPVSLFSRLYMFLLFRRIR
jgi:SAM-dependent methyltransferase